MTAFRRKAVRQFAKDFVLFPALSGPRGFLPTAAANLVANLVRNVWSHAVIFCGHFPEPTETFSEERLEGETRGEWYVRQMLGSANLSGSPALPHHDRQPVAPDRAPLLPRHAEQPLPHDRPARAGDLPAQRPELHHRPAAQAVLQGAAQDRPPRPPRRQVGARALSGSCAGARAGAAAAL